MQQEVCKWLTVKKVINNRKKSLLKFRGRIQSDLAVTKVDSNQKCKWSNFKTLRNYRIKSLLPIKTLKQRNLLNLPIKMIKGNASRRPLVQSYRSALPLVVDKQTSMINRNQRKRQNQVRLLKKNQKKKMRLKRMKSVTLVDSSRSQPPRNWLQRGNSQSWSSCDVRMSTWGNKSKTWKLICRSTNSY